MRPSGGLCRHLSISAFVCGVAPPTIPPGGVSWGSLWSIDLSPGEPLTGALSSSSAKVRRDGPAVAAPASEVAQVLQDPAGQPHPAGSTEELHVARDLAVTKAH